MTDERLNELLMQLDQELIDANNELIKISEEEPTDELMKKIDYWTDEIYRISNEMQSLLKSL